MMGSSSPGGGLAPSFGGGMSRRSMMRRPMSPFGPSSTGGPPGGPPGAPPTGNSGVPGASGLTGGPDGTRPVTGGPDAPPGGAAPLPGGTPGKGMPSNGNSADRWSDFGSGGIGGLLSMLGGGGYGGWGGGFGGGFGGGSGGMGGWGGGGGWGGNPFNPGMWSGSGLFNPRDMGRTFDSEIFQPMGYRRGSVSATQSQSSPFVGTPDGPPSLGGHVGQPAPVADPGGAGSWSKAWV